MTYLYLVIEKTIIPNIDKIKKKAPFWAGLNFLHYFAGVQRQLDCSFVHIIQFRPHWDSLR